MAECVRERPKQKRKKKNDSKKIEQEDNTGQSYSSENVDYKPDNHIADLLKENCVPEKIEEINLEEDVESRISGEEINLEKGSVNADTEVESKNEGINSVSETGTIVPEIFEERFKDGNDSNLTRSNEPVASLETQLDDDVAISSYTESSAPLLSLDINEDDIENILKTVSHDVVPLPCAESSAPLLSLDENEFHIDNIPKNESDLPYAESSAPLLSLEVEENTPPLINNQVKLPQENNVSYSPENVSVAAPMGPSVRPRSQVISQHLATHRPLSERTVSSKTVNEEVLSPFTEEQLSRFYYNQELQQIDFFVDEFLKNSNKEQHEFYELVLFYYKSRKRLGEILDNLENLQKTLVEEKDNAWIIQQQVYTAEGECACKVKVVQKQNYQKAFFQDNVKKSMSHNLFKVRGIAHETLPLELYNSHVAKLRIEDYLSKRFKMSPALLNLDSTAKISDTLPSNLDQTLIQALVQIQDCISVLFVFKRHGVLEVKFSEDIDVWLSTLVGVLQRAGTLPDSFFIMNHLLRCPPTTVVKISNFLQFPSFNANSVINKWNSPLVHHFIVMLATLTLPVRCREEFLQKFKSHVMQIEANKVVRSISWTLVDEEKEEDERLEKIWSLMTESDLIAVFDQFPFTQLLVYLLDIQKHEETLFYSPSKSTSNDLMSLFAFSSCLVNLLSKIFDTYTLIRYRQFLKCVSRTIRLVTQVVSDHWLSYRSYRLDIVGDDMQCKPTQSSQHIPTFTLARLQVEFDQLFINATKRILSSHSAGAIQFLSTMPFEAVQPRTMWIVLFLALDQHTDIESIVKIAGPDNLPSVKNLDISPSEGIFLLTALSNMALARDGDEEKELINAIAVLIVEISFLNVTLSGLYTKNGKDLLGSVCHKHNFVVTALLDYLTMENDALNKHLTYLFDRLPLINWIPTIQDLERLRKCLLKSPVSSEENKMARLILSGLNYSSEQNSTKLFLPRSYHYIIGIMLVEAYGVSFPDYPGGIPKLDQKDTNFIAQVGKYAVSSFTKLMQSKVHAEYLAWGWEVLLKLKLHESQAIGDCNEEIISEILLTKESHAETWCGKTIKALQNKRPFEFHVQETSQLINVNLALKTTGLYASYLAFCLTKDGHFVDLIMSKGLVYMNILKDWYQYDALLNILHCIVPIFHATPEKLVCDSFLQILNKLLHIDVDKAGYTEKIWQYFIAGTYSQKLSALIISQILQASKHSEGRAQGYIMFWMDILLKMNMWYRDFGVLFQIDRLCEVAFTINGGITIIEDCFYDEYKKLIKANEPRGLLSSMMSWISTNHNITFTPSATGDFCYYAYVILRMEKRFEDEIGIWKEISTEMICNPMVSAEDAYKKSLSNIKSLYVPSLTSLSIYRWGEQAIATPNDHPMLPIIWQRFFLLFLRKPEQESGLPNRTGIGMRFFTTIMLSSFAKKMKNNLQESASYHLEKSNEEEDAARRSHTNSKEYHYSKEFHLELSNLYQSFSLWLEESRLHDASLYLDSLPEVYNPRLLLKVFQGNQDIWHEYICEEGLQKQLNIISAIWLPLCKPSSLDSDGDVAATQTSSRKRIVKRLSSEGSPLPPPDVVRIKTPVEEISLHLILTQPRLFQEINNDLNQIVQYAKISSSLQASHVGLDNEFLEMLPDLYEMVYTRMLLHIPCEGKLGKECKAPAKVTITYEELRLRERVSRLLEDNRSTFEQLLQRSRETFPYDLCINTVHVENIIEKLAHVYQTLDTTNQMEVQQSARKLFYLLAELIDNDVKRCYPAIQFFSSGIEVLGKAYIAENPSEQMPLLETIVNYTSSVMFLVPHFHPMSCSTENFTELYSKMVSYIEKDIFTVIFVLLSKFDVANWLTQKPSDACVVSLLTSVVKAAGKIGREPDTEGFVILELVRNHFVTLLCSDLNGLYSVALSEILTLSCTGEISIYIWNDFLATMDWKEQVNFDIEYALNMEHVKESIHYMASFFMYARESVNGELETLYKTWESYMASLCIVLKNLFSRSILHSMQHTEGQSTDTALKELWENLLSVFQAWIVPQSPGKIWTLLRAEKVQMMVREFTELIQLVVDLCTGGNNGYCFILNDLLNFYESAILVNVKEEQSLEIFHTLFITLPWQQYCPSIQELTYAIQVYGNARSTFDFYSTIFLQVEWSTVCMSYINSGNPNAVTRFNHVLLHVILMLTTSNELVQTSVSKLKELLNSFAEHNWSTLVLEDLGRICQWYSQNVEAALLLQNESIVWTTLKFLKTICGFVVSSVTQTSSPEILAVKRNMYVQVVATLITRSSSHKNQVYQFQWTMGKLLGDIELVVGLDNINPMQELVTHCATCLSIQNSIASGPVSNAIKTAISSHLLSTNCPMMVLAFISSASRCLANIHDMVELLENAISCHFVRLNDEELVNSWVPVINSFVIPQLNKDDFVNEAIKQNALLTLYSYNLSRMSLVTSHAEQLDILIDCVTWCAKPQLDKDSEAKLLLLWLQIFDIIRVQSVQHQLTDEQWKMIAKYMMFLAASTQTQGEDKSYSGVLGIIGIGRRSGLSKEFRVTAKAMHLFLVSQLPSSLIPIRTNPDSPGAIRNATNKLARATQEAEKTFTAFQALVKNKNYQGVKEQIQWVVDYVSNPRVNISDGCGLIAYLCKQFFYKQNFIGATIT